jgi:hypothetical protein
MYLAPPHYFVSLDAAIRYWSHWEDAEDMGSHPI